MRRIVPTRFQHAVRSMSLTARGLAMHHSCTYSTAFSLPLSKRSGRLHRLISPHTSPHIFAAASAPKPLCCSWEPTLFLVTGELFVICYVNARLQRLHPFTNMPRSLGGCNLSSACFPRIVQSVSALHLPLLILGGGGYNEVATVKAWVAATAAACGAELPGSVPLHDFYAEYGPTFCFQHVSTIFIHNIVQSTLVTVGVFTGLRRLDAR